MKPINRNLGEYYNAQGQKEFYKGTSFRVHTWSLDTYYFNNDQYIDWVIYNGIICVCARTHISNADNAPVIIYKQGIPVGIESNPCWDFVFGGLSALPNSVLSDPTRIKLVNNDFYISNDEGNSWEYIGTIIAENPPVELTASVVSVNDSDQAAADVAVTNNHLQFSFVLPRGKDGIDGKDGVNGKDGASVYFLELSNEYDRIPTINNKVYTDTIISTKIRVLKGSEDVTSSMEVIGSTTNDFHFDYNPNNDTYDIIFRKDDVIDNDFDITFNAYNGKNLNDNTIYASKNLRVKKVDIYQHFDLDVTPTYIVKHKNKTLSENTITINLFETNLGETTSKTSVSAIPENKKIEIRGSDGDVIVTYAQLVSLPRSLEISSSYTGSSYTIVLLNQNNDGSWSDENLEDKVVIEIITDGKDGVNGEDGASVEYIFANSAVDTVDFAQSGLSKPDNAWLYNSPQGGWHNKPQGVSPDNPVEWVCERIKQAGHNTSWEYWSTPSVFSRYGKDGKDGIGVEYVFLLDTVDPIQNEQIVIPNHINKIMELAANQSDDYQPTYDNYQWKDDVQQVTPILPYCWCSIRRNKNGIWGQFETPTLWSKYVENGYTRVLVKIWKRSDTELSGTKAQGPTGEAIYDVNSGLITLPINIANDWSTSGILTRGRYLYSLGAYVTFTNVDNQVIIDASDWNILTLESVDGLNGSDGTGQSAVIMTVDPDVILVNVDDDNISRLPLTVQCSANYYYGTSLQESNFSYVSTDNIFVSDNVVDNLEHTFNITIPEGISLNNSIPVTITLTPVVNALKNSDDTITELHSLSKNIYITPIKSNDTWSIDLNTDQIIDHDNLNTTVTATIIKNGMTYTGDDAKLWYLYGAEELNEFPNEGLRITHDIIAENGNTVVVVLVVHGQSILHQNISILRNGVEGPSGVGIAAVHEHYYWSNSESLVTGFTEANFVKQDLIIKNEYWTYSKPSTFNATCPYLWNIETIEYSTGEYQSTGPILISASGKGIKTITEYYLISELASGVTFSINNQGIVDTSTYAWSSEYSHDVNADTPYLWNVEVIEYTDGTYFSTPPIILSMYSKGEPGDPAKPVYTLVLDKYSIAPLYILQDDKLSWLDPLCRFEGALRKNNVIVDSSTYTINPTKGSIYSYGHDHVTLNLKSIDIRTDFTSELAFIDNKTHETLLVVPITIKPKEAQLTVSLNPDRINLGYRQRGTGITPYSSTSQFIGFKTYINDEVIDGDLIDVAINSSNFPTDLKPIINSVSIVKNLLNQIAIDFPTYYQETIQDNPNLKDLMYYVETGQLSALNLVIQYRESPLKINVPVTLTTDKLNPDYLDIYTYPNVILPTDTDQYLHVRLRSLTDDYITNVDLANWDYIFQYNIDNKNWTTVTSDYNFSMGYFIWLKSDILENIKFRITDKNGRIYVQEVVERVPSSEINDYFNNIPTTLDNTGKYQLEQGYYEFEPAIVDYNAGDYTFSITNGSSTFLAITRYTSESENKQLLAKKVFNILYVREPKFDTVGLKIPDGGLLGCTTYNPEGYISIFQLKPGFTSINVNQYSKNVKFKIPFYIEGNEFNNISDNELNDLYSIVGNTYNVKITLPVIKKYISGISWDHIEDGSIVCKGIEKHMSLEDGWILFNITYQTQLDDNGNLSILPNIIYKTNMDI